MSRLLNRGEKVALDLGLQNHPRGANAIADKDKEEAIVETKKYETVLFERRDDGIAIVTINRPHVLNALNDVAQRDLLACWDDVNENENIRVAIVTAVGDRAFCAGKDLKETVSVYTSGDPTRYRAVDDPKNPLYVKKAHHYIVRKPLIGAINGLAVGAGFDLFRMCDLRVMAENAWVGAWGQRLNLASGRDLYYQLPWAVANWLRMTGSKMDAQMCLHFGLVTKVVPATQLMPAALEYAQQVLQMGPDGIAETKNDHLGWQLACHLVWDVEEERQRLKGAPVVPTPRQLEGQRAFVEKRRPIYSRVS